MKIYDTYQEAKIENPDCDIYVLEKKTALMCGKFQPMSNAPTDHFCNGWRICKPADYLPSVEWFYNNSYFFECGDLISNRDGNVIEIGGQYIPMVADEYYVLRASCLTEAKVITESPEEKEALDMIDTTSKQVESLAKGDVIEWKNGDKCRHEDYDDCELVFIGMSVIEPTSKCHVEYFDGEYVSSYYLPVDELEKPESPEQKSERERDEKAKQIMIDICGDDVFKDRNWDYHKKFSHSAKVAFQLVDLGYRKQ